MSNIDETTLTPDVKALAEQLIINIDGFQGPLDMLLALARVQKVDLRKINVLSLAEQYLAFVEEAKRMRLELAADYLVMAAWLAYLKSRLLLPPDPEEEGPSAEELAAHLAFQLERLEAMRDVAARLMARDQLGRDFFPRGDVETQSKDHKKIVTYKASILDLMQAYAKIRRKDDFKPLHLEVREETYTMEEAFARIKSLIGDSFEWKDLKEYLPKGLKEGTFFCRSATASTFAASLELVKSGQVELYQAGVFQPITIKRRSE